MCQSLLPLSLYHLYKTLSAAHDCNVTNQTTIMVRHVTSQSVSNVAPLKFYVLMHQISNDFYIKNKYKYIILVN